MRRIRGDGVTLAVLDEGEGNPSCSCTAFPTRPRLATPGAGAGRAGFRVIAPDLRGSGVGQAGGASRTTRSRGASPTSSPSSTRSASSARTWSGTIGARPGWALAVSSPRGWNGWSGSPSGIRARCASRPIEQRQKAWYQLLFQFEGVAEELVHAGRLAPVSRVLEGAATWTATRGPFAARRAHRRPDWYRANLRPRQELSRGRRRRPLPRRRSGCGAAATCTSPRIAAPLGPARHRAVALRAHRRCEALDAARRAGSGQRAAARVPLLRGGNRDRGSGRASVCFGHQPRMRLPTPAGLGLAAVARVYSRVLARIGVRR